MGYRKYLYKYNAFVLICVLIFATQTSFTTFIKKENHCLAMVFVKTQKAVKPS